MVYGEIARGQLQSISEENGSPGSIATQSLGECWDGSTLSNVHPSET